MLAAEYRLWTDWCGIGLIGYSILGLALILERTLAWRKVKRLSAGLSGQVQEKLRSPDRQQMKDLFQQASGSGGPRAGKGKGKGKFPPPLASVMSYVLGHDVSDSPETTEMLLDDALEDAASRMKKHLVLLASLAGTAPFLGLLGTVLGIMHTFTSIRDQGLTGGPEVISAGIAQALQTTAMGLVIAIPTFIAYNLYSHRANEHVRELRMQANRILVALGDM